MGYKVPLRHFTVSREIFDTILERQKNAIKLVDEAEFHEYYYGYKEKNNIMYNGYDMLIIQQRILAVYTPLDYEPGKGYIQFILHLDELQEKPLIEDITGFQAWCIVNKILSDFYTEDEIKEQLEAHEAEYNKNLAQYHFTYSGEQRLVIHENCCKYDINGAHCDALCEIFPKAKKRFTHLYLQRKVKPEIKKWFNYYVGMLAQKGHRKTYNWIVQRTTKQLMALRKECAGYTGIVVYGNTDGIIIENPEAKYPHSTNLGEFKLEFEGTVYTYAGKNYWIFQYEKDGKLETTGSLPLCLRKYVDLRKGQVVSYNRVPVKSGDTIIYKYENVEVKYAE